jgi:LDH2 family malate/lactate/ureidoglycolate dehydrogenase
MGTEVIDFNKDQATITNTGQAILVIDPDAFGEVDAFKARVDKLVRELRGQRAHAGRGPHLDARRAEPCQAPRQRARRPRAAAALRTQLDDFAREIGIPLLQDTP